MFAYAENDFVGREGERRGTEILTTCKRAVPVSKRLTGRKPR